MKHSLPDDLKRRGVHHDYALTEELAKFYDDPLGYVMFIFPWDTEPSIQMVKLQEPWKSRFNCEYGPDKWACEFLDDLGNEIKKRKFNGRDAVEPIRFATASGHGIGKSTLVAWLIKFILDTRPFSIGVVTANTSDQLKTKTWAELAKWHHMSLTSHLFHYTSGRGAMSLYRVGSKGIQAKWRCDAQTCREENSEAFQGLHSAGSTPFYIFDEASGIPDKIFEARSGGLTDGEPMVFDFGNPTRKSGMFFENCIGRFSHRYNVRSIDSRSVAITNKSYFQELVNDYGEESDYVKVKVRGIFPSAGTTQFISTDLVREAQIRPVFQNRDDPLIIGVDVARFGDNSTVLFPRIGMDARSFPYKEYKGLDQVEVAEAIVEMIQDFQRLGKKCAGLFIDGGGLGVGPIDILRRLGYNPIDVINTRIKSGKYAYRSDQMWGKMRDALNYLALPKDYELEAQLTQREFGFEASTGRIRLETKKQMEDRGILSPDVADALALTFASDISSEVSMVTDMIQTSALKDYDPLEMSF